MLAATAYGGVQYHEKPKSTEVSVQVQESQHAAEAIKVKNISKKALNDIKHAAKILMQQKKLTSYFEGAIEYLIKNEDYKPTPISTNGEFWGEIDVMEDYERVCESISDELVNIANRNDIGR